MGTRNSNKSRIIICIMELKYYIRIFNQSVIWHVRSLEVICHLRRSRVRGDPSFAVIEVERVKRANKFVTFFSIQWWFRSLLSKESKRFSHKMEDRVHESKEVFLGNFKAFELLINPEEILLNQTCYSHFY